MLSGNGKTTFVGGPAGPPNTLSIGTVTTGAPGSQAQATITGAAPAQALNLQIPQGPVGATGATGQTGATGPSGNTVLSGSGAPSNASGANGDVYIDTANSRLYGPKTSGAWPGGYISLNGVGAVLAANNLSDLANLAAALQNLTLDTILPQGRVTLTSGQPVLSATVTAATTLYYAPYLGRRAPIWNATLGAFVPRQIAELSQALSDTTRSPAAAVANQVYDLFLWDVSGAVVLGRGPAWAAGAVAGSNAARGTGAGSTELTRVSGLLVNKNAIENGPAAGCGLYVGTVMTDASGATVSFNTGTAAAGGGAATIGLWNAYNRVTVRGQIQDTTASWTNPSAGAWRAANGSSTARVTFVAGLAEDSWAARYVAQVVGQTTGYTDIGVGYDTTTAFSGVNGYLGATSIGLTLSSEATAQPLGQHFFSAVEYVNAGTSTFIGKTGATGQSGLAWDGRC